jgi:(p)ppGpp synthase/HD superfamily hydrolase
MSTHWSIDEIQQVWQLASGLHKGQTYGGPNEGERVEYLNHIGGVVLEVLNAIHYSEGMNADLAIKCAMLHDTIEDTPITYESVKELFGQAVADGVLALSKDENVTDRLTKMTDSLERIKKQPAEIGAVKLADRIHNLYAPPFYWSNEQKENYLQEAGIILQELGAANQYLADRLKSKIAAYRMSYIR